MQNYSIKVSFNIVAKGFGMSTRDETHDLLLSAFDENRIRE
jgi:hypothetical protein